MGGVWEFHKDDGGWGKAWWVFLEKRTFSRNTHRAFLWGGVDSRQIKSRLRVHLHPCTVALHRPSSRFHWIAAPLFSHVWKSLFQNRTRFTTLTLLLFGSFLGSGDTLSSHAPHRFLSCSAVILRGAAVVEEALQFHAWARLVATLHFYCSHLFEGTRAQYATVVQGWKRALPTETAATLKGNYPVVGYLWLFSTTALHFHHNNTAFFDVAAIK